MLLCLLNTRYECVLERGMTSNDDSMYENPDPCGPDALDSKVAMSVLLLDGD